MNGLWLAVALLAPERVAALPAETRAEWQRYLETSRRQEETDRAALPTWRPAPAGPAFALLEKMEPRRRADVLLSYQTPTGGWSKNLDLSRPRAAGEGWTADRAWRWVGTLDNDATVGPLRLLAAVYAEHGDAAHAAAFRRGLDYLHLAQLPNGCWPQVYPLQGDYHDAATFNDDAIAGVLNLLLDVARGDLGPADDAARQRALAAVQRGTDCLLASQVVVDDRRTVWGAQHDPLTLEPVAARAYEPASLSGVESAGLVDFLMRLGPPSLDARVKAAVDAAVVWFRAAALYGHEYTQAREWVPREGAGPLWARFYEIGTNRPIFGDRDRVVRYDWSRISDERRRGYAWFSDRAAETLRRYESW